MKVVHTAAVLMFLAVSLTPRQQEALHYLMTAGELESTSIGDAGSRSGGYVAMQILQRSGNADAAFKELIAHGTIAGQLYGLIGVRRTDPAFFRANIGRYAKRTDSVRTVNGCLIGSDKIATIVSAPNAIQLPQGTTLQAWFRDHPGQSSLMDIEGGSYSSMYLDTESTPEAERDARTYENRFKFP